MKQCSRGELVQMAMAQLIFGSDLAAGLIFFISVIHKMVTKLSRLSINEQKHIVE
jgi:hypothetical protein